jgi:hypothetical protein
MTLRFAFWSLLLTGWSILVVDQARRSYKGKRKLPKPPKPEKRRDGVGRHRYPQPTVLWTFAPGLEKRLGLGRGNVDDTSPQPVVLAV